MLKPLRMYRVLCLTALLVALTPGSAPASDDAFLVLSKAVPSNARDLRVIEQTVGEVVERIIPATVGVRVGNNHGSGVVISENGLVLTAAHVIGRPGRDAEILFPDGTTVRGKTLGMHAEADGALIQISADGKWPFAPLVPLDDYPKPGDWCVATGHPGGFDPSRTPPVRLGRIIDVDKYVLRTDCTINSGDSGGPLFDLQGQVIGIHSRIAEGATINLHGPVLEFAEAWEQMKDGAYQDSRFLRRLDINGDGKITRSELSESPDDYRRIYDRLIQQYELDAEHEYSFEELKGALGWRDVETRLDIRPYNGDESVGEALAKERFIRGREVREAFRDVAKVATKSVVQVQVGGKQVALGTIVDAEGLILTKASEVREQATCKMPDGTTLKADVVASDTEFDLALLRVDAKDLSAISVAQAEELHKGAWLISAGPTSTPLSVGVLSVSERKVEGTPGVLGVEIEPGTHDGGALVKRVFPRSGAERAGLQANDLIVDVMGKPVHNIEELREQVYKFRPGDVVSATILRGEEKVSTSIRLGMPQDIFFDDERFGSGRLNGALSQRRDDFDKVLQHDSVLKPAECGGPLLDVNGNCVAINIARADRVATYAVPLSVVQEVMANLLEQGRSATGNEDTQEAAP